MKTRINLLKEVLVLIVGVFCLLTILPGRSSAQSILYKKILTRPNGCTMVWGGIDLAGEFILEQCGSKVRTMKIPALGYTKQIQFINSEIAWGIVGSRLVKFHFGLRELTVTPVPVGEIGWGLEDLYFVNESYGWACGWGGLILRTTDGGETWKKMDSGTQVFLREIRFTDNNFGWSIGRGNESFDSVEAFLTTDDGGETWKELSLPDRKSLYSAFFTSNVHGCGVGEADELLCTSDGKFWNTVKTPGGNSNRLFFLDSRNGWAVGGSIFKTINGGKSWTPSLKTQGNERLYLDDVYFSDKQRGWAWGLSSAYETRDGGKTWEKISEKWLPEITKAKVATAYSAGLQK